MIHIIKIHSDKSDDHRFKQRAQNSGIERRANHLVHISDTKKLEISTHIEHNSSGNFL